MASTAPPLASTFSASVPTTSFGLVIVALIANQLWKPGLLRGHLFGAAVSRVGSSRSRSQCLYQRPFGRCVIGKTVVHAEQWQPLL